MKVTLTITQTPTLRYSKKGLAICTFRHDGVKFIAFDKLAKEIAELVVPGDTITVSGYYKPYTWRDKTGEKHIQEDFNIKSWGY